VAENNVTIGNGGHGIEVQNNVAGSTHAPIIIANNTAWGNEALTTMQNAPLCAEVLLNSAYNVQEHNNLVATKSQDACLGNPVYALSAFEVDGTVHSYSNFAFAYDNQNTWVWDGGTFAYDPSNVLGVNPNFSNAYVPGAPACSGFASVTSCMATVIGNFTPTNNAAVGFGYQVPSSALIADPLFPTWACNANLPAGLITKPC
jgi:hypothetical protein